MGNKEKNMQNYGEQLAKQDVGLQKMKRESGGGKNADAKAKASESREENRKEERLYKYVKPIELNAKVMEDVENLN